MPLSDTAATHLASLPSRLTRIFAGCSQVRRVRIRRVRIRRNASSSRLLCGFAVIAILAVKRLCGFAVTSDIRILMIWFLVIGLARKDILGTPRGQPYQHSSLKCLSRVVRNDILEAILTLSNIRLPP